MRTTVSLDSDAPPEYCFIGVVVKVNCRNLATVSFFSLSTCFCSRADYSSISSIQQYFKHSAVFQAFSSISSIQQIKQLISKARKRVGMLGRLRRSVIRESANIVYCSLIRTILEYCVSVRGYCGEGHKHGLEALKNRAARIVARTVRSNPAMDVLKWPTLEERRRKTVFKLVKKCLQGQCPQYFKEYFKRNNTIYARATRRSNLLHPPAVRTEIAKRSFCYYGCTLFNELS